MNKSAWGEHRRRTAIVAALLLLLVVFVYWPVGGFGFVPFDDNVYVYRNPHVLGGLNPANVTWSFTTLFAGFWIPMTWLSLMADASLWGVQAGGFHWTNVALHAAAVLLFFQLLRRLLGGAWIPLLAAALFAAHPLHVESVAWVTERKDVLSQALFLLFLHAWLSHLRRPSPGSHARALLVLVLTLMAKPMAFTAPVLLLVLDWWPLGRLRNEGWKRLGGLAVEKVPAALIGLFFGILTMIAQQRAGALLSLTTYPLPRRAGNAVVTTMQNLGRTLWPADLSPLYTAPPGGVFPAATIAAAATLLGALVAVAFLLRRRQPWLAAGFAWYIAAIAPLSGIFQTGDQITADRFTYLPLLGMHTAVACLAYHVAAVRRHPARAAFLLLFPALLAIAAHRQALFWQDGVTLFSRAVAVSRDNPVARNNLGAALLEAGRPAEALPQFEAALRLDPVNLSATTNLGGVLGTLGHPDEGIAYLRRAIELDPQGTEARVDLGDLLLDAGRLKEAEQEYQAALATDPLNARTWYLLGTATARNGNPAAAERQLRRALDLQPDWADAGYNLALAILDQGRSAEARELLEDLQRQHPTDTGIAELRKRVLAETPAVVSP